MYVLYMFWYGFLKIVAFYKVYDGDAVHPVAVKKFILP